MHAWLDFVTKLQKYFSFANSWSTNSNKCKNLDAIVPDQLLATNAYTVAYQMEEKNSGLVVILHCLNSFQHNNYMAFHYCLIS